MKNKKLNLEDLKVKSFVTNVGDEKTETIKGGSFLDCQTDMLICGPGGTQFGCSGQLGCGTASFIHHCTGNTIK